MLRLFYLFAIAAVMLAPCGCAGAAWWLADDADDADQGDSVDKPRAGSVARQSEESVGGTASSTPQRPSARFSSRETTGNGSPARADSAAAGKKTSTPFAASTAEGSKPSEPLADEIRALGFDDPAEEQSALAALRAAPAEHRQFLLRTMQASAAVRKQREGLTGTLLSTGERLGEGQAPKSASPAIGSNRLDTLKSSNRFARSLADSSTGGMPVDSNANLVSDPYAVAASGIGPAEELTGAVRPASHIVDAGATLPAQIAGLPVTRLPDVSAGPAGAFWQTHLHSTIAALEAELAGGAARADRAALEAKLRLLYLAADRRDEALRSRAGTSTGEQEFWSKEIFGLATLIDAGKQPDARQRAALAAPHLRQAAERLGEIGGLAVKNLHFCTEVKGYGAFVGFAQDVFRAGQEVLLYCEVENFQSKLTEKGHHTALKAHYQIFDASGSRVAEKDLGLKDEHCQNRRRDFFVPYFLWMPKQAPPGKYQLKLTLEDVHAGQTAEASIEFEIKGN